MKHHILPIDDPDLRGVEAHMPHDDKRADLFQHESQDFHFPCSSCAHRDDDDSYCRPCRHYAT